MSTQLFIITYDCQMELDGHIFKKIYTDLETAKNELRNIYNKNPDDFGYYGYNIMVYSLDNNEFIFTNTAYLYNYKKDDFDEYLDSD